MKLTGDTKGYDPDHPEWLGWDLRLIGENLDQRTGYATASAQTLRVAAHQFDGKPIDWTAEQCRAEARALQQKDKPNG